MIYVLVYHTDVKISIGFVKFSMHIPVLAFTLTHIFADADVAGGTRFLDLIGEERTYLAGTPDMKDIDLGRRLIGGTEVESTEAEETFPEGAFEGDIEDTVQAYLILAGIEDAGLDDEAVIGEGVGRERPRETEDDALTVVPEVSGVIHS